jgi:predicted outer membrane lipoprotein
MTLRDCGFGLINHLWLEGTKEKVEYAREWIASWLREHHLQGQCSQTVAISFLVNSGRSIQTESKYFRIMVESSLPIDPVMVKLAVGGKIN